MYLIVVSEVASFPAVEREKNAWDLLFARAVNSGAIVNQLVICSTK